MCEEIRNGLTENKDIIKSLKSNKIENIQRVYYKSSLKEWEAEKKQNLSTYFNLECDTVLITLSNADTIGFGVDDVKDSIVSWLDVHNGIEDDTQYYYRDWSSLLTYDDPTYSNKDSWTGFIGEKITRIRVLTIDLGGIKRFNDSFQRAIILETNKDHIILSFCLKGIEGSYFPISKLEDFPQELMDKAVITEF
ncbi:hypothetical protein [Litoribrevibacter albus]|uniref:Uncharacterized protein n=1 Tax=Litoribrevibacter albus TaxID=1473156 RepID=A0AA37W7L5_9GAMM|nr:hypothetical protein [Litoribrevibacter albus]GLQ32682.1 hypothetical protein GCM10007876_31610 [Litoribrevibacter albus]